MGVDQVEALRCDPLPDFSSGPAVAKDVATAVEREHVHVDSERARSSTWSRTKHPYQGSSTVGYMFVTGGPSVARDHS